MGNVKSRGRPSFSKVYKLGERIGSGSFSVVRKATHKQTGAEVAVKIIRKANLNASEVEGLQDEITLLQRSESDGVVKLLGVYDTSKEVLIVMEYLRGGELFDRVVAAGSFSEREAARIIIEVSNTLKHLHDIGIVHRDLKPENLVFRDTSKDSPIVITDFGLARVVANNQAMTTACGTPGYVAPEILRNEPYTSAVDIWSLGVILYILLCGFPPFYADNPVDLYAQIKAGDFAFISPYWDDISEDAKDLISRMLTVEADSRIDLEGVLSHPWLGEDVASALPLSGDHGSRLQRFAVRAKLRRGILTTIALSRLLGQCDDVLLERTDSD
ncbi:MAG: hypothetical protein MHM6MM_003947 [Cercozoa sp. M6MM]